MSEPIHRVFIAGCEPMLEVVASGENYFETMNWRFSWPRGDGLIDADSLENTYDPIRGRDVAGIANLKGIGNGKYIIEQDWFPVPDALCLIWSANGARKRIVRSIKFENKGRQRSPQISINADDTGDRPLTPASGNESENTKRMIDDYNARMESMAKRLSRVEENVVAARKVEENVSLLLFGVARTVESINATSKETRDMLPDTVRAAIGNKAEAMMIYLKQLDDAKLSEAAKSVANMMIQTGNRVRETSRRLTDGGMKNMSRSNVSRILKAEIDPVFGGRHNPFKRIHPKDIIDPNAITRKIGKKKEWKDDTEDAGNIEGDEARDRDDQNEATAEVNSSDLGK